MLQILGRTCDIARYGNHAKDGAFQVLILVEAAQGLDEEVDALVLEFVTAAVDHHQAVGVEGLAAQSPGNFQDLGSGGFAFFLEGGFILPKGMVDAILRHHIGLAVEELLTLLCRDVAHRREGVGILGRLLLHRLLRDHVKLHGHHRRQVSFQVVVQRQAVARDGTAEVGGVRGEHRGNLWTMLLQIKHARTRHPLVELRHDVTSLLQIEVAETLDHLAGGIAEQHRLDIIPLAADAVQFILFPKMPKDFVLGLVKWRIVHKNGDGAAFDLPSSDTAFQALN